MIFLRVHLNIPKICEDFNNVFQKLHRDLVVWLNSIFFLLKKKSKLVNLFKYCLILVSMAYNMKIIKKNNHY